MAAFIFWTAFAVLLYTYLGYWVVLRLWGWAGHRPVRKTPEALPRVSVLIAAHDEAHRLAGRIDNCVAVDYPADRLEVVVVSDGSTDGTEAILAGHDGPNLRWTGLPRRLGKAAALNAGAALATGEIIVFTDVRQRFQPDAIRQLVANFADPEVGAVTGELVIGSTPGAGHATSLYWEYEKSIRKAESRVDSVVGVTGAIYAIRRTLFTPLPVGTILDDVLIPMRIALAGYRVVFEEQAVARDVPVLDVDEEYRRKVRTLAGNYQLLRLLPALLLPHRNRLWFQFMSHKVSRLAAPVALLTLLLSSAALATTGAVYLGALAVQTMGYGLAMIGWLLKDRVHTPATAVPLTFVMLNLAAVLGLLEFLRFRGDGAAVQRLWSKAGTERRAS